LLRVNRSGTNVKLAVDEKAVLRSALGRKDCVMNVMNWNEVAAALTLVSGYERGLASDSAVVRKMACAMRKEGTKEAKQGGKQGGKNTGKKKAGKKDAKKVAERGPAKKGGKVKAKAAKNTDKTTKQQVSGSSTRTSSSKRRRT
jgi:hypothetical protein